MLSSGPVATWIFGYGSLIFRPSFPVVERRTAALAGYARRFWQGSIDHRGTPEAPGRVVTLIEAPGATCVGVAYRIAPDDEEAVLAHLDVREQNGYERLRRPLLLDDPPAEPCGAPAGSLGASARLRGSPAEAVDGLVYLAGPTNPSFLGPAPLEQIARQIAASQGPSGSNAAYLLSLADALRALDAPDEHVFALESLVRGMLSP